MAYLQFPPPADHQEFERLMVEIASAHWRDSSVSLNGSPGQSQHGVDVNVTTWDRRSIGIQCKLTTKRLTIDTVKTEIARARQYAPLLDLFCIATTATSDSQLLAAARTLPPERFGVEIWSWTEINRHLNRLAPLGLDYARRCILGPDEDIELEHAKHVREALDRPGFLHGAHAERNFIDQRQAIQDTSKFLRTGYLYTRDGHLVSQLPASRYSDAYSKQVASILRLVDSFDKQLTRQADALMDPNHDNHESARAAVEVARLKVLIEANKLFARLGVDELSTDI